jgi:hypothetical protein
MKRRTVNSFLSLPLPLLKTIPTKPTASLLFWLPYTLFHAVFFRRMSLCATYTNLLFKRRNCSSKT